MPGRHSAIKNFFVAVYFSEAGNGYILTIPGIKEKKCRLSGIVTVFISGSVYLGWRSVLSAQKVKILQMITALQTGTCLQMQFNIRTKDDSTGSIGTSSAKSNTAASVIVTCVNRCLNRRCIIVNTISDSSIIVYVINHNYSHLHNMYLLHIARCYWSVRYGT